MIYTHSGNLPFHMDIWVDGLFVSKHKGFRPARWFGLCSRYGEMWGCHVLLESGAVYRNVPPHALSFMPFCGEEWGPKEAQTWDCYGPQFSTIVYDALRNLDCEIVGYGKGRYLFTAVPLFDAFTRDPGQSKEFMFLQMNSGRLAIRTTDQVIFRDKSFTNAHEGQWPKDLKRQTETYHCE